VDEGHLPGTGGCIDDHGKECAEGDQKNRRSRPDAKEEMPKKIREKGTQADTGIGRNIWIEGSIRSAKNCERPITRPMKMPATEATAKPANTRAALDSTEASHVRE